MPVTGQAIVEFALVLPILLLLITGFVAVADLTFARALDQNGIDVLARLAASDPGWRSKVDDENARVHCYANPTQPDLTYPFGDERYVLTWTCHYRGFWPFDGWEVRVSSEWTPNQPVSTSPTPS